MHPASTRQRLLEAGARLVLEGGFQATGIQQILKAAGAPKGSFYHHFESKEAYGAALLEFMAEARKTEILATAGDATLTPLERIRRIFFEPWTGFAESGFRGGCPLGNMALELADKSEMIRQETWRWLGGLTATCQALIEAAQAAGELRADLPAERLAEFLVFAWEGAVMRSRLERSAKGFILLEEMFMGLARP